LFVFVHNSLHFVLSHSTPRLTRVIVVVVCQESKVLLFFCMCMRVHKKYYNSSLEMYSKRDFCMRCSYVYLKVNCLSELLNKNDSRGHFKNFHFLNFSHNSNVCMYPSESFLGREYFARGGTLYLFNFFKIKFIKKLKNFRIWKIISNKI
jgi:hypothetical protein